MKIENQERRKTEMLGTTHTHTHTKLLKPRHIAHIERRGTPVADAMANERKRRQLRATEMGRNKQWDTELVTLLSSISMHCRLGHISMQN